MFRCVQSMQAGGWSRRRGGRTFFTSRFGTSDILSSPKPKIASAFTAAKKVTSSAPRFQPRRSCKLWSPRRNRAKPSHPTSTRSHSSLGRETICCTHLRRPTEKLGSTPSRQFSKWSSSSIAGSASTRTCLTRKRCKCGIRSCWCWRFRMSLQRSITRRRN